MLAEYGCYFLEKQREADEESELERAREERLDEVRNQCFEKQR
jgi:hypothetical protein